LVAAGLLVLSGQAARAQTVAALTLQDCLHMAFEKQPALAAARASLAAAQSGQQGVNNLGHMARLLAPDLPVRRQQASLGVTIAQAALAQAEWETRYAVTRNYFTIQYIREQQKVLAAAIAKLNKGLKISKRLVESGEVTKVTKIDIDTITLNIELLQIKEMEAAGSLPRAVGALREAIGVGPDCPLDLVTEPLPALLPALDREALIAAALHNRGEVIQAGTASQVSALEVRAQCRARGPKAMTFAGGADIHAKPIPQGISNSEYRPGAIGPEMPPFLVGPKCDRVQRAQDLSARAVAVVDKTTNLVALEVDEYYLKWFNARQRADQLSGVRTRAKDIGERVESRFDDGKASGEEYLRAATLYDQAQGQFNEALYNHALALAALERATAGAVQVPPPGAPSP
jgi:outer membrane protein TolC